MDKKKGVGYCTRSHMYAIWDMYLVTTWLKWKGLQFSRAFLTDVVHSKLEKYSSHYSLVEIKVQKIKLCHSDQIKYCFLEHLLHSALE